MPSGKGVIPLANFLGIRCAVWHRSKYVIAVSIAAWLINIGFFVRCTRIHLTVSPELAPLRFSRFSQVSSWYAGIDSPPPSLSSCLNFDRPPHVGRVPWARVCSTIIAAGPLEIAFWQRSARRCSCSSLCSLDLRVSGTTTLDAFSSIRSFPVFL